MFIDESTPHNTTKPMRTYMAIMCMIASIGGELYAQDSAPTPIAVSPGSPVTQQMIDMATDTVRQGPIDFKAMKIAATDKPTLDVYPNPASDHVTVVMTGKVNVSGPMPYFVTDLTRRAVLSGRVESLELCDLDVKSLPNGSYQLHVQIGRYHMKASFVVAR